MLVVVGGHSRNIGKTSVAAGIIRALPERNWTAMKITQFGHGVCSASGDDCQCCLAQEHPFAIVREKEPGRSDTGRFLAAGARNSYWVRTAAGNLGCALPEIQRIFERSENVIVESNSIMQFLKPELYLVVLDFAVDDFKSTSRRFLERADAYAVRDGDSNHSGWEGIRRERIEGKPWFAVAPPEYFTAALGEFVSNQLAAARF